MVIKISKSNTVSIGAHPSFKDLENFGRKKINLPSSEVTKLIVDQYEILQQVAQKHNENVTHIKPHGALNNMDCEDFDLENIIAKTINNIDKNMFKKKQDQSTEIIGDLTKLAKTVGTISGEPTLNFISRIPLSNLDNIIKVDPSPVAVMVSLLIGQQTLDIIDRMVTEHESLK